MTFCPAGRFRTAWAKAHPTQSDRQIIKRSECDCAVGWASAHAELAFRGKTNTSFVTISIERALDARGKK